MYIHCTFSNFEHDRVNRYTPVSETYNKWFPSRNHLPENNTKTVYVTVRSVVSGWEESEEGKERRSKGGREE